MFPLNGNDPLGWEKSYALRKQADDLKKQIEDLKKQANALKEQADNEENKEVKINKYNTAIKLYEESYALCNPNSSDAAWIINMIASIYSNNLNNFNKAEELYTKVYDILIQLNNYEDIAIICRNFGVMYEKYKMLDKAINYYNKSQSICDEHLSPTNRISLLTCWSLS